MVWNTNIERKYFHDFFLCINVEGHRFFIWYIKMTICDQFQDIVPFYSLQMLYIKLQEYPIPPPPSVCHKKIEWKTKISRIFHRCRQIIINVGGSSSCFLWWLSAECTQLEVRKVHQVYSYNSHSHSQHAMCVMSCTSEWCSKASSSHPSGNTQDTALSHSGIHMAHIMEESHTIGFSWAILYFCRLLLLLHVLIFLLFGV